MKKRIGNDIPIVWTLTDTEGNPYDLTGKEFSVCMKLEGMCVYIPMVYTFTENVISFTFYGKDQPGTGIYDLILREGDSEVTYDVQGVVELVPHSWDEDEGDITIESEISTNGEVNVIEVVKVNGVALHVVDTAVDIEVPTQLAQLAGDDTHRLVTDTEKSTWNGKQDKIDSSHKLDYSLIDNTPTIPVVPTNVSAFNNDAGYVNTSTLNTALADYTPTTSLATVATSGSYNDLLNKPTIPAAPGTLNTDNSTAQSVNSSEALSGTIKLHKVSKTGSYNDLLDKPTIPAAQVNADWDANSGVAEILHKPAIHNVPAGGSQGQVLAKSSGTDYAVEWVNQSGGTTVEANPTVPSGTTPTALTGLKIDTSYYSIAASATPMTNNEIDTAVNTAWV